MEVFKIINNFWLILYYRKGAWLILRPDYLPLSISQTLSLKYLEIPNDVAI